MQKGNLLKCMDLFFCYKSVSPVILNRYRLVGLRTQLLLKAWHGFGVFCSYFGEHMLIHQLSVQSSFFVHFCVLGAVLAVLNLLTKNLIRESDRKS